MGLYYQQKQQILKLPRKINPKKITSFLGNINKKPLVGLGVVGTKTLIVSCLVSLILPVFSLVAKPTAQIPVLGY